MCPKTPSGAAVLGTCWRGHPTGLRRLRGLFLGPDGDGALQGLVLRGRLARWHPALRNSLTNPRGLIVPACSCLDLPDARMAMLLKSAASGG